MMDVICVSFRQRTKALSTNKYNTFYCKAVLPYTLLPIQYVTSASVDVVILKGKLNKLSFSNSIDELLDSL